MEQFSHFRKLPQEIQNEIWDRAILHPTPCVQAVALCGFKEGSELVHHSDLHLVQQRDRLRMLLPDPILTRRSPYYYTLAQAAPVCRASYDALVRAQQERGGTQITVVGPHPYAALTLRIGEKKTMGWTIVAAKGRLTEEDKTLGHDGDHVPDPIIASRDPCNNILIFTNPTVDILLIDFPLRESSWLSRTLTMCGFYEPNLIQLERLAIQFDSRFERLACFSCELLPSSRQRYQNWLETKPKSPREISSTDGPSDRRIICLLCTALEGPELADLSEAEMKQAKDLLKLTLTTELMLRITRARDDRIIRAISMNRINRFLDTPYDIETFFSAQPLLQRVFAVRQSLQLRHLHDNHVTMLNACLADFDGDTVALYNEIGVGADIEHRYYPQQFDETSGRPICLAGQEEPWALDHNHKWCNKADIAALFWPVTTPNLQTIYVIDSGIKLKPGASIPPGTQTFKGNNCRYVEVPPPVCRSLEKGGEDAVWQYPAARAWGANVFDFARHLDKVMVYQQDRLRRWGYSSVYNLDDPLRKEADACYRRAVEDGNVPECRILAF